MHVFVLAAGDRTAFAFAVLSWTLASPSPLGWSSAPGEAPTEPEPEPEPEAKAKGGIEALPSDPTCMRYSAPRKRRDSVQELCAAESSRGGG